MRPCTVRGLVVFATFGALTACDPTGFATNDSGPKAETPAEGRTGSTPAPQDGTTPQTAAGKPATPLATPARSRLPHLGKHWIGSGSTAVYSRPEPDGEGFALWLVEDDADPVRLINPEPDEPVPVSLDAARVHYLRMPPYDTSKVYPDPEGPPVRIMELDRKTGKAKQLESLRATDRVFRIREWFYIATAPGSERIPTPRAIEAVSVSGSSKMPVYKYAGRLKSVLELDGHAYWLSLGNAATPLGASPGSIFRVPLAEDGRPAAVPEGPFYRSEDDAPWAAAVFGGSLYALTQGRIEHQMCGATLGRWNETRQAFDPLVVDICSPLDRLAATATGLCWIADPVGRVHDGYVLYCYAPQTDALTIVASPAEGFINGPIAFGDGVLWSEVKPGGASGATYVATP